MRDMPIAALLLAMLAAAGMTRAGETAPGDVLLPWEGGPAHYAKWPNGPRADPDFFPISVWLQNPATAAQYQAIGINQFIGLWKGPTEEQLRPLAAAGMPVFAAHRPGVLEGSHAAIIRGWTLMDEPDNAQPKPGGGYGPCVLPPLIVEQYEKIKAADPTRPVFLNLGQAVINEAWVGRGEACGRHNEHYPEYIRGADIVSYDVYPVNGNLPLWYVGAGVDRLRKWADYRKPVWNWIETTAIRGGAKPTPEQIRAEVWMSIIHGAMGIGYFCHQFKPTFDESAPLHDPATRQALAAINEQIRSLARVLNTPSVANGVTVTSSNADSPIDVMLKRHGGQTYLLAVGARPGGKTTARFKLRECGELDAAVLGESRTVRVSGGLFEDSFSDYQVHLYRLPFVPNSKSD